MGCDLQKYTKSREHGKISKMAKFEGRYWGARSFNLKHFVISFN